MIYTYNVNKNLSYSEIDRSGNPGIIGSMQLAQDMTTSYFNIMGTDNLTLRVKDNALWVITRSRFRIYKNTIWNAPIRMSSHLVQRTPLRVTVETRITDDCGQMIIAIRQEFCPLDLTTHRIRKIETISFPSDAETETAVFQEDYEPLKATFCDANLILNAHIVSSDIDYSNHVNNVMYVKYIYNCFSSDFWITHQPVGFEVHHIAEAKEAEEIHVYYKKEGDNTLEFLISNEEKEFCRVKVMFKELDLSQIE